MSAKIFVTLPVTPLAMEIEIEITNLRIKLIRITEQPPPPSITHLHKIGVIIAMEKRHSYFKEASLLDTREHNSSPGGDPLHLLCSRIPDPENRFRGRKRMTSQEPMGITMPQLQQRIEILISEKRAIFRDKTLHRDSLYATKRVATQSERTKHKNLGILCLT
jgi:hypothetical protein